MTSLQHWSRWYCRFGSLVRCLQ